MNSDRVIRHAACTCALVECETTLRESYELQKILEAMRLFLLFVLFVCVYVAIYIVSNYTFVYHRRPTLTASWLSGIG